PSRSLLARRRRRAQADPREDRGPRQLPQARPPDVPHRVGNRERRKHVTDVLIRSRPRLTSPSAQPSPTAPLHSPASSTTRSAPARSPPPNCPPPPRTAPPPRAAPPRLARWDTSGGTQSDSPETIAAPPPPCADAPRDGCTDR